MFFLIACIKVFFVCVFGDYYAKAKGRRFGEKRKLGIQDFRGIFRFPRHRALPSHEDSPPTHVIELSIIKLMKFCDIVP